MMVAAIFAHAGSAVALLIILSAELRPALLAAPQPAHALALEPGLRCLLFACAVTPRLTALPMAVVARRARHSRWFGAGAAVLAAESVLRASTALVTSRPMTPVLWVARLRPPAHVMSATVALALAGYCWAKALADAMAAKRGSADGPDVWNIQEAATSIVWTLALSLGITHVLAPLAVAFVLRLG
jgi:hypothetical protein